MAEALCNQSGQQQRRLKTMGAGFIQRQVFDPLVSPVEGLIVEGLTLLCGASKIGKSWFVLDMCCSVSSGRPFLGHETQQGSVLYLALEDSPRRIKSRLDALGELPMDDFMVATEASLLDAGLLDELNMWVQEAHSPRLIIIDTLQKIRGITSGRVNIYQQDYDLMGRLKYFADRHHIAIVLVHHLSKSKDSSDPFDRVSGSTGLMGAADTTILIDRPRDTNDAKLIYTGRDVYGDDLTLRLIDGRWNVIGRDTIEREQHNADPIVSTIKGLLSESFGNVVQMPLEEFKEAVATRSGVCPAAPVEKLARLLAAKAPDLLRYDGVVLERTRVGTRRGVRFSTGGVHD